MAVFSIGLCILLVICGTQASSSSMISSGITNTLNSLTTYVKEGGTMFEAMINYMTEAALDYKSAINSTVQNQIDQWDEKFGNLCGNATSDRSSCSLFLMDLKKHAQNLVSDGISCVEGTVTDLQFQYGKTKDAIEEIINNLDDIGTRTVSCGPETFSHPSCVREILLSENILMDLVSLLFHGGKLVGEIYVFIVNFHLSLITGCGFSAAMTSLTRTAEESYSEIEERFIV